VDLLFSESALPVDRRMRVEGEGCSIGVLLVPDHGGAGRRLDRLGVS
jgi:hypothetical protein